MSNTIDTYQRNGVTVTIGYDDDGSDSPATWGNYQLVTFGLNLSTDTDQSDYFDDDDMPTAELREWLITGKAFGIDYLQHGDSLYRLNSSDSTGRPNGLIIFDDAYIANTSFEERQKYAEGDLETYTDWANGNVYYYSVVDSAGNDIDTLYSIYGYEYAESEANAIADAYTPPRSITAKPASAYHA